MLPQLIEIGSFYIPGLGVVGGVLIIVAIGAILSRPEIRKALVLIELPFTRLPNSHTRRIIGFP